MADYMLGSGTADTLVGMDGDDVLDGGAGNDWLVGDMGSDTFVLKAGGGSDQVVDFPGWSPEGPDTNRIVVSPSIRPDQVVLFQA